MGVYNFLGGKHKVAMLRDELGLIRFLIPCSYVAECLGALI